MFDDEETDHCELCEARTLIKEIRKWLASDLKNFGPGPNGGFQLRIDTVDAYLNKGVSE